MKKLLLCAVVFLSGCANFDMEKFSQGFNQSMQQYQQNQQIIQSMQPYSNPYQPYQAQKTMVPAGILKSHYVNGTLRYCVYTNGVVNSISSLDICPLNNP